MYSIVMVAAMTASPEAPDFFKNKGGGCYGCYGGGCYGSSCYGSSCYGCYGSGWGYGGCWGGGGMFGHKFGGYGGYAFVGSGCCGGGYAAPYYTSCCGYGVGYASGYYDVTGRFVPPAVSYAADTGVQTTVTGAGTTGVYPAYGVGVGGVYPGYPGYYPGYPGYPGYPAVGVTGASVTMPGTTGTTGGTGTRTGTGTTGTGTGTGTPGTRGTGTGTGTPGGGTGTGTPGGGTGSPGGGGTGSPGGPGGAAFGTPQAIPGLPASRAQVIVRLPADAKLYADGTATMLGGAERVFLTPEISTARDYTYTLKADYGTGEPETKQVVVRAGHRTVVEFAGPVAAGEKASSPVTVTLPEKARLFVDGVVAATGGGKQTFRTPELAKGKPYVYEFRAEVDKDGKTEVLSRQVTFKAGEPIVVNFVEADATRTALK
jgi:uncharacterized protein (TIGR03000 family)